MSTKLIFLGSGSAFTIGDNFHSNMLLEDHKGRRLLIDCGTDVRLSLHAEGYSYRDISDVYISHLHADHCGGLEWLGFSTKFDESCAKPRLHLQKTLAAPLWETCLKGGMQSLSDEVATLASFFDVKPFEDEFTLDGVRFHSVKTRHVFNGSQLLPSFGLQFMLGDTRTLISTDAQLAPELMDAYYRSSDLIFHDCETVTRPSGVHAHYHELKKLNSAIKAKMWLYHFNPGPLPDAKKDGFLGFVKRGQTFEFKK